MRINHLTNRSLRLIKLLKETANSESVYKDIPVSDEQLYIINIMEAIIKKGDLFKHKESELNTKFNKNQQEEISKKLDALETIVKSTIIVKTGYDKNKAFDYIDEYKEINNKIIPALIRFARALNVSEVLEHLNEEQQKTKLDDAYNELMK